MGKEYRRNQRVAKEIQKKIAVILQQDIKDPRVSMATVSGVDLSRDLAYAKVFVSFFHNYTTEQVKTGVHKLQAAAGFIRGLLGKTMYLRVMPELTFCYDNSLVEGMRMYKFVSQIAQKDLLYRNFSEAAERKTNGTSS